MENILLEVWVFFCRDWEPLGVSQVMSSTVLCCAHSLSHIWLFCNAMDCSLPGSSVCGISQARILEYIAISSSRESSCPRDWTHVFCISCIGKWILYHWVTWEAQELNKASESQVSSVLGRGWQSVASHWRDPLFNCKGPDVLEDRRTALLRGALTDKGFFLNIAGTDEPEEERSGKVFFERCWGSSSRLPW